MAWWHKGEKQGLALRVKKVKNKILTFVGGDAYSAPIVHVKETGANPKDDFYYLHRDYLGSIMAITDSNANIVEQRQFGACGGQSVKKMSSGHF